MGIIKLGLISLLVFILIITGISLFFPSHIRISKAIDIGASKEKVMEQLSHAANWKNWFHGADSLAPYINNNDTTGIIVKPGQAFELTTSTDSTVYAQFTGAGSKRGKSGWNILHNPSGDFVTVQWYMDFHLRWYPWEKFSSMLLEKRYGPIMEKGLDNLKKVLEDASGK